MLCVADLLLFGDGGLLLLQHGEKLCDLQLKTLLWGRPVSGDLCLNPCYLGLERLEQETESKPGKKRSLGKTTTGSMLEDIFLCFWPTTCKRETMPSLNTSTGMHRHLKWIIISWFLVPALTMGSRQTGSIVILGSCYPCGCYFDTYYVRKHCCRPRTSFHGNNVPWWLWPLAAG